MKLLWGFASVALVAIAVLGLTGSAAMAEPIPFQGSLDGLVSHTSVDDQTDYVLVEAEGTATLLGQFEVVVPHFVDTPTRTAAGYYEFTAANGDKLVAWFTGQATPTTTPGVIAIVETATIDPDLSTGRFAGATGGFEAKRLFDRIADTTIGSFKGTISLDVDQP